MIELLLILGPVLMLAAIALSIVVLVKLSKVERQVGLDSLADKKIKGKISKKIEEESVAFFKMAIAKAVEDFRRDLNSHFSVLASESAKQSQDLASFVKNQQEAALKENQLLVAQNLDKVDKEIESYRQAQFKKIDSSIHMVVASVAKEVLGRTISLSEHEDLVKRALERAKKSRFFE